MSARSPFHPGEQAVQERVGVRAKLEQIGPRIIRDFMPDQHRELFEELPFVVAGSADGSGALWASLLIGDAGFVSSPDAHALLIQAQPFPGDPLRESLRDGAPLGLLGIELPTRRRNRANGHVATVRSDAFEMRVEQSFGNCPKYIQARGGYFTRPGEPALEGALLSEAASACIARSDTTFIATSSHDPEQGGREGLDISHRGGRPRFVRVARDGERSVLTMPDYLGNFMFNTLGNLQVDPRAGLLVLDFASGALLSLTGEARVIWDSPELPSFEGAERLVEFRVSRGLLWQGVASNWSAPELSPHLP
jgi:predicted pyridoxine 5'-phosphate oxidase superfamily flavin-nucleotide-binding protein